MAPPAAGTRQVLLVLGMHRSGTSATAGLLVQLGAQMARTPIRGDANNPRGYWEPEPLVSLHNRLLAEAGSTWDDWGRLAPDRLAPEAAGLIAQVFQAEFGDAPLAVLKDPRICRFLPLWLELLAGLGVTAKAVIPLRHPFEVARSLERRDGMPREEALLLWLRHCLEAERATRGIPRCLLPYEALVTDWRACADRLAAALDLDWPVPPDVAAPAVEAFLSADMRHHVAAADPAADPELAAWVGTTRTALDALAAGEDPAASARLDAVGTALDAADALMGRIARRQRVAAEAARAEADGLAAALATARAEAGTARAAAEAARTEAAAARLETGAARTETTATRDALAAAQAAEAESEHRAETLQAAVAGLQAEQAAVLGSRSWRATAPMRALADRLRRMRRASATVQSG